MTHISFSSLFRKNNMGGKTDWVGKKLTSQIFPWGKKLTGQFFPRGKNGPAHSFPGEKLTGEKTDRYTSIATPGPRGHGRPRRYFFCGSFMFLFCLVFAMFCARLFKCALWSPAGKGLTSWLSFVVSSVSLSFSHWYPGSGVVLDCIDSWSLQPYYFGVNVLTRMLMCAT